MKPVELEITERKIVVDIIHAPAVNGAIFNAEAQVPDDFFVATGLSSVDGQWPPFHP